MGASQSTGYTTHTNPENADDIIAELRTLSSERSLSNGETQESRVKRWIEENNISFKDLLKVLTHKFSAEVEGRGDGLNDIKHNYHLAQLALETWLGDTKHLDKNQIKALRADVFPSGGQLRDSVQRIKARYDAVVAKSEDNKTKLASPTGDVEATASGTISRKIDVQGTKSL
jgi:hypothetical protein